MVYDELRLFGRHAMFGDVVFVVTVPAEFGGHGFII